MALCAESTTFCIVLLTFVLLQILGIIGRIKSILGGVNENLRIALWGQ